MNAILLGLPGGSEIWIILLVIVLLFGAKKIPQLMRGIGSGVKEFKEGMKEGDPSASAEKNDQAK